MFIFSNKTSILNLKKKKSLGFDCLDKFWRSLIIALYYCLILLKVLGDWYLKTRDQKNPKYLNLHMVCVGFSGLVSCFWFGLVLLFLFCFVVVVFQYHEFAHIY